MDIKHFFLYQWLSEDSMMSNTLCLFLCWWQARCWRHYASMPWHGEPDVCWSSGRLRGSRRQPSAGWCQSGNQHHFTRREKSIALVVVGLPKRISMRIRVTFYPATRSAGSAGTLAYHRPNGRVSPTSGYRCLPEGRWRVQSIHRLRSQVTLRSAL